MQLQGLFRRDKLVDPDASLDRLRYVVFDTEFTSLEQRTNRLLSIGAVAMRGSSIRLGGQFYAVTNPGVAVPGSTVVVHKLRPDDIAQAESLPKVLEAFLTFSEGAVLVGHFVHYDTDIVHKELAAIGRKWNPPAIDTALVHRALELKRQHYPVEAFDERIIRTDLASVATHYGIQFEEAHHALADAFVTAQVWQRQLAVFATRGVRTWKDLRRSLK